MSPNEIATDAGLTTEDVWRQFGAELRSFVHRRIGDPHHADDIVSEVLIRIHKNLRNLDDSQRLAGWVFRIARNAITDEYRRAGRDRELLGTAPGNHATKDSADDWDDEQGGVLAELAACLRPLLDQLTPAHRRALQLTELDGTTQAAAARLEGISVSGMKSRVQRGRQQLAELLGRCCALTLDARGLPMGYTRSARCGACGVR